ncbi:hypothetical protein F441_11303 [Phytophthora nicotianae CJ01A1]|uniref:Uncharacterized protein n=6 Tax=Phytophthora nicotianae TaxID=4792 RepID=W2Q1F9_PHYN3|nr:hypothetical protein PPTG_13463 [Phytophthora nicotianae INRA-310]ETI43789.1 hypothetical protein F443_11386 [Phytophthora nicotianae P1569]ETK83854.1 hypothetical protein L915_11076 [Phytophthora nicotianae]ETO72465.1 hypothetical protein F444_11456 [Phytophthora nicotianae P1976]ETP13600.1 hypothetical protein F441_11303 [Phytophthora nicotianae CJ01A1]ETP41663.1 hypothetical protein F442_11271 [Phytophthora nicotianae P10297]
MRKNSGDRTMSAALQHRKVSGSFEKSQAEKLHSNVVNRHSPVMARRSRGYHSVATVNTTNGNKGMGLLPSLGIGVAVAGSMFVVSYAAVLSAMTETA